MHPYLDLILSFLLLWFLPGFSFVVAVFPKKSELSSSERLLLSIGLSVVLASYCSVMLASFNVLYRSTIVFSLVVLSALLLSVGIIRGFKPNLHSMRRKFGFSLNLTRISFVLVACLILIPNFYYMLVELPLNVAAWRSMADAMQIATAGGIPPTSYQWSTEVPFAMEKIGFYSFLASFSLVSQADPILIMRVLSITVLSMTLLASILFLRSIFKLQETIFGMVLIFLNPYTSGVLFIFKQSSLVGEALGLMLLFIILWAAHKLVFLENRKMLILLPITLCCLAIIHEVPAIIGAILIFSFFLAKWLTARKMKPREVFELIAIAAPTILGVFLILAISRGMGYFNTIVFGTSPSRYEPFNGYDPTFEFISLITRSELHSHISTQFFYMSPFELLKLLITSHILIPASIKEIILSPLGPLTMFLVLMIVFSSLRREDFSDSGTITLSFIFLFVGIYLMAVVFSFFYKTYIPAMHVIRREATYVELILAVVAINIFRRLHSSLRPGLFEFAFRIFHTKYSLRIKETKRSSSVIVYIMIIMIVVFFAFPTLSHLSLIHQEGISSEGFETYIWLKANSDKQALILCNHVTYGVIEVIAERRGVLEGRIPYLEPPILSEALKLMLDAKNYFLDPSDPTFIREHNITHVVVAPPDTSVGGDCIVEVDPSSLSNQRYLQNVASFGKSYIFVVNQTALL